MRTRGAGGTDDLGRESAPPVGMAQRAPNSATDQDAVWLASVSICIAGYEADWPAEQQTISVPSPDKYRGVRRCLSLLERSL